MTDAVPTPEDLDTLSLQLGRPVRDVVEIPARCVCGSPLVAATAPRLSSGIPFPTTFYLTHPAATQAASRLEADGVMAEMSQRLVDDPDLAAAHREAHRNYLSERERIRIAAGLEPVWEIEGVSAGGYPERVKCLHVLVGHALAVGPGITPLGDETLERIAADFSPQRCVCAESWDSGAEVPAEDLSRHVRLLRRREQEQNEPQTQAQTQAQTDEEERR
ncbi:MAG: DUF501 domain-containing protein [Nesterenkonia sp.]|nr:DUF501 domain-containing protein [Nesterenkonia sp.]